MLVWNIFAYLFAPIINSAPLTQDIWSKCSYSKNIGTYWKVVLYYLTNHVTLLSVVLVSLRNTIWCDTPWSGDNTQPLAVSYQPVFSHGYVS
jgi:hypothetical protein